MPLAPKNTPPKQPKATARGAGARGSTPKKGKKKRRENYAQNWRNRYLRCLSVHGRPVKAAEDARVDRVTVYKLQLADVDFAKACEVARMCGARAMEEVAVQRATEGVRKIVVSGGLPVRIRLVKGKAPHDGSEVIPPRDEESQSPAEYEADAGVFGLDWDYLYETTYSDRLLELLLKRNFPGEYREKLADFNLSASANSSSGGGGATDAELANFHAARARMLAKEEAEQRAQDGTAMHATGLPADIPQPAHGHAPPAPVTAPPSTTAYYAEAEAVVEVISTDSTALPDVTEPEIWTA